MERMKTFAARDHSPQSAVSAHAAVLRVSDWQGEWHLTPRCCSLDARLLGEHRPFGSRHASQLVDAGAVCASSAKPVSSFVSSKGLSAGPPPTRSTIQRLLGFCNRFPRQGSHPCVSHATAADRQPTAARRPCCPSAEGHPVAAGHAE